MLIDFSPLVKYRDYRYIYIGQVISFFGTMATHVALPYHVYLLTKSSTMVGTLAIIELVPLVISGFVGGVLSDTIDRRKLLIRAEAGLAFCLFILTMLSRLDQSSVYWLFLLGAVMSALVGIHRPTLEAMTPRLVPRDEIPSAAALNSLKRNIGMILGPAVAGIVIAEHGLTILYVFDLFTYIVAIFCVWKIHKMPPLGEVTSKSFKSIIEGLKYAKSRQEILGSYVIDIVAMVFAMPMALLPALSEQFGDTRTLGWMHAAPSIGAFLITIFSGWSKQVYRHGAAIAISAALWGLTIVGFGFSSSIYMALVFLAFSGAFDMISGLFRSTIWNQTIPDRLRGRMASLEMLSYMSGPMIGNFRAGLLADATSIKTSIVTGGILCVIAVGFASFLLPLFWWYDVRSLKPDA